MRVSGPSFPEIYQPYGWLTKQPPHATDQRHGMASICAAMGVPLDPLPTSGTSTSTRRPPTTSAATDDPESVPTSSADPEPTKPGPAPLRNPIIVAGGVTAATVLAVLGLYVRRWRRPKPRTGRGGVIELLSKARAHLSRPIPRNQCLPTTFPSSSGLFDDCTPDTYPEHM